jgi:hypothetical protein
MLCLFHGDQYWRHSVVWIEHQGEAATAAPSALHVVQTNDSGRVVHLRLPPSQLRYVYPTNVKTTVGQFVAYLCRRLMAHGGDAWEVLGLERPPVEPSAGGPSEELVELYTRAARLLQEDREALVARYGHLNPGLQAMNLRNRLRAKGHNV